MGSFQFTIHYDADKLRLAEVNSWYPGVDDVVIGQPAPGLITFVWAADSQGITINDGVLCNLNFTSTTTGEPDLSFTGNPTLVEFTDYEGNIFEPVLMKSVPGRNLSGESVLFIYPNPGKGIFNLRMDKEIQGQVNLKITNALGGIVFEEKNVFMQKPLSKTIDLSGLSDGIYILSVESDQEIIQKKIILNK
jgi:hypothetical protein